nr:oxidoreductase [Corynebacterium faecium]
MMWDVFNLFGKGKKSTTFKPPRAPGETIRPDDAQYLRDWVVGRSYVEGFVEPETMVNEMSVVLVDEKGNYTRRRIGGPKGIDQVAGMLGIMLYDVEETGYPDRMRKKIEQERILRKREEQKERRARFERGENPYG